MKARRIVLALGLLAALVAAGAAVAEPALQARVKALEGRVAALEKQVADLEAQIAALKNRLDRAPAAGVIEVPVQVETTEETLVSVKEVTDGATLRLADGHAVRLIGVDISGVESASGTHCRALAQGKVVRLEFDNRRRDAEGRLLAYVYVGGTFVNADLIRNGFARAASSAPNLKHDAAFADLEREARAAKRGMWGQ